MATQFPKLDCEQYGADFLVTLAPDTELDIHTQPTLCDALEPFIQNESCQSLILNISEIRFLGAAGLSAFEWAAEECGARNKQFTVVSVGTNATKLLNVLALVRFDQSPNMRIFTRI